MKQKSIIGIEITASEVRGACVRTSSTGPLLSGIANAPTPAGAIDVEGMLNPQVVGDVVRRVYQQLDPKGAQLVIGMTNCSMVARIMEIPPVPNAEIRAVLRGEMDHFRILPAGQSSFDFCLLPEPLLAEDAVPHEENTLRVLLMGAEERLVNSYRAVADAGSVNVVAVEPGSIAIIRALYPQLKAEEAIATVMLSATGADIIITHKGDLQFFRRVDTGVPELMNRSNTENVPGNHQMRGGLLVAPEEVEDVDLTAIPDSEIFNRQAISLLMTEVQRSIDFYTREFPQAGEQMQVFFAIDSPEAGRLFDVMTQYLRANAQLADIRPTLSVSPEASGYLDERDSVRYLVAVGLALRGIGGDYNDAPALDLGVGDSLIVERRMVPRVMTFSMVASGAILIGAVVGMLVTGNMLSRKNQQLIQVRHEFQVLSDQHASRVASLDRQKKLVETIHFKDKPLRETIEFVSASVSRRACLTSLAIDQGGVISISGEAVSPRIVADIMDTINLSPVLEPIRLSSLQQTGTEDTGSTIRFDMQTGYLKTAPVAGTLPGGAR